MSTRQGWKINNQHFARTTTPHGGERHFIDGKPVTRVIWQQKMKLAELVESARPQAGEELDNPAFTERFRLDRI